jgi:hypothetical protein
MWADTTFRRLFVDKGSNANSASVALAFLPDTLEPNAWHEICKPFTGDPIPTIVGVELGDRMAHKRRRTVVRHEADFDESTLGKYRNGHIEKKLLGSVHRAYIDVENALMEIFCYGKVDARWIGRVALLMSYPERGPHAGAVDASNWAESLRIDKPELWALLGRNKSRDLGRLANNIETVLGSSKKSSREKAIWRCRKAIGIKPVHFLAYEIHMAAVSAFFGYFSQNLEEVESNHMDTAS